MRILLTFSQKVEFALYVIIFTLKKAALPFNHVVKDFCFLEQTVQPDELFEMNCSMQWLKLADFRGWCLLQFFSRFHGIFRNLSESGRRIKCVACNIREYSVTVWEVHNNHTWIFPEFHDKRMFLEIFNFLLKLFTDSFMLL